MTRWHYYIQTHWLLQTWAQYLGLSWLWKRAKMLQCFAGAELCCDRYSVTAVLGHCTVVLVCRPLIAHFNHAGPKINSPQQLTRFLSSAHTHALHHHHHHHVSHQCWRGRCRPARAERSSSRRGCWKKYMIKVRTVFTCNAHYLCSKVKCSNVFPGYELF